MNFPQRGLIFPLICVSITRSDMNFNTYNERVYNMKKFIGIFLTLSLALMITACGSKDKPSQGGASLDDKGNEIAGTTIDGAGKEVDMDKFEGVELESVDSDNEKVNDEGRIGNMEVSIEDAKVMTQDDTKILVISFDFKNLNSSDMAFDNLISVDVTQAGISLMPTVVTGVKGINVLSGVELIPKGKETTVQKTFVLSDEETPVDVTVYKYGETGGTTLMKAFNLK